MTSITVPKDADVYKLQPQAQPQGQMFESLKKQLEGSSFDQLFQSAHGDQAQASTTSEHVLVAKSQAGAQALSAKTQSAPSAVIKLHDDDQRLGQASSTRFASNSIELTLAQITDPHGDALMGLQSIRRVPAASGASDGELLTKTMEVYAASQPADSTDVAQQAVVVGIDGEGVRVWMRDNGMAFSKERLISKIRAELSWAGMALEAFVLNGKKLVGK